MKFRWNASFSKNWSWQAGEASVSFAERTMRAGLSARGRLIVRAPFGNLRVAGCDEKAPSFEIRVRAERPGDAAGVTYRVDERDGETEVVVEGAPAKDAAEVCVELSVPRGVDLEVHCGLGNFSAADVGPIEVDANLGAVAIAGALSDCSVRANAGAVVVTLAAQWAGERVSIGANLGPATLRVPAGLELACTATSTVGRASVECPSADSGPPATVHCNVGDATIVPAP